MEIGAIGFHSEKNKKFVKKVSADKDILKLLKKTMKEEEQPDFRTLKENHR